MGESVAVIGAGAVSALGPGLGALRDSLTSGCDGIGPVLRFSTETFGCHIGGMVPDSNSPELAGGKKAADLAPGFAVAAILEALSNAGISAASLTGHRCLLVMGASQVDSHVPVHELVAETSRRLGFSGPALTVSTACSSSAAAIALGVAFLRGHLVDVVIAGGADVLVPELYGGFDALGLLTPAKCAPFGSPFGTTLGEGAGFVVLQRGPGPGPAVLGYGLSNDAWHETSPHPRGEGLAIAIRACLDSAGVLPGEIAYVNAHGTGTEANDAAELRAVRTVLGEPPPISSSKGVLGHAQAAAGALEAITTLLAMEAGRLPPSPRSRPLRAGMPESVVSEPTPLAIPVALSHSAAFSGSNAVLALGREGRPTRAPTPAAGVFWLGASACGRHGGSVAGFFDAVDHPAELPDQPVLPSLAGIRIDPRGLDAAGSLVVRAAADALADAAIRPSRENRGRIGVIGGGVHTSPSTHAEFNDSITRNGAAHPSVAAFARMVLNAPAGAAARAFGLQGAHTQIAAGGATGVAALVVAATLLADDGPTDTLVVTTVDEASAGGAYGAAAVVLGRARGAVRIAGWSAAGRAAAAEREALGRAGLDAADYRDAPDQPVDLAPIGSGPAVDGAHRLLLAVRALGCGAASAIVVEEGSLGAFAVVLRPEPA